jgi:RimJ/RimL family protein N-acetyltransferase
MSAPLTFRRATPNDAEAIVAMFQGAHVSGNMHVPTLERVREKFATSPEPQFVVVREGAPVGFVLCCVYDGWLVEIRQFLASVPRTGVGSFAMRETLRWAFAHVGAHRAYLEVRASNAPARALYESFGFTLEGTWREGFRAPDGTFYDLCAYGLLHREYKMTQRDDDAGQSS